ncbi:DUF4924 family protein [Luteibaculum oceani]|uniref:DUF4924 family protein n=1 Tax=Luteibaculum oceani TaxID=1294296 RepID=A0A5C6VAQ5_9FLAO|nr:DUF4924 family protein [Luteibaculum oceani]TXC81436.1 DUF4924 family protein [Luteibaculum oceani]
MSLKSSIQSNLAEHILFLWQTEDLLRALSLDFAMVKKHLFKEDEDVNENPQLRRDMNMYQVLIEEMKQEGIEQTGHLRRTLVLMSELEGMHKILSEEVQDANYLEIVARANETVGEFVSKKASRKNLLFTEACLNAMYGILVLRLQGKDISQETEKASEAMKEVLRYLSKKYNEFKAN